MAIVLPTDLRHLIFGGGGGRGWAHIGAISELERLRRTNEGPLVPVPEKPRRNSRAGSAARRGPRRRTEARPEPIVGVAGASIGAFVAMCVALGATADDIAKFAKAKFGRNRLTLISENAADEEYLVPIAGDKVPRLLDDEYWLYKDPAQRRGTAAHAPDDGCGGPIVNAIRHYLTAGGDLTDAAVVHLLTMGLGTAPTIKNGHFGPWTPAPSVFSQMRGDRYYSESIVELIGSTPFRVFFSEILSPTARIEDIRQRVDRYVRLNRKDFRVFTRNSQLFLTYLANLQMYGGLLSGYALTDAVIAAVQRFGGDRFRDHPATVTFRQLYAEQGVELAVTGTHLARRKGELFSYRTTPDFAIAAAVATSMRLPLLFKPVSISGRGATKRPVMPAYYEGRWSDGGMTNNLPLRAFARPGSLALSPRTLGFALTTPPVRHSGTTVLTNLERIANEYLGVYADQSTDSQLETESDRMQVVEIDVTKHLSTTDVAYDQTPVEKARQLAADCVNTYFARPKTACFEVVTEWQRAGIDPLSVDGYTFEAIARAQFRAFFPVVSPQSLLIEPFKNEDQTARMIKGFSIDIIVGLSSDRAQWEYVECKGSGDAELSKPQAEGHPLMRDFGGILVNGREVDDDPDWRPFRHGMVLPKRKITVVRPSDLCSNFEHLVEQSKKTAAAGRGRG